MNINKEEILELQVAISSCKEKIEIIEKGKEEERIKSEIAIEEKYETSLFELRENLKRDEQIYKDKLLSLEK